METKYKKNGIIIILLFVVSMIFSTSVTTGQELCPATNIENGAISINATPSASTNFSAGLLGTFDRLDTGNIVGGIDWLYSDEGGFSTTSIGAQLIAWWNRKDVRNTQIQLTNQSLSSSVSVHVQIFDENCVEIRDFCDNFTSSDTHTYDFSNIVTNTGTPISSSSLTGKEGFITITPNVNCGTDFRAMAFPQLSGDLRIDNPNSYQYGTKMWARDTDTLFDCTATTAGGFKILDGVGDCGLEQVRPSVFSQVFSSQANSDASRADLIIITLSDFYSPDYSPIPGSVELSPLIIDLEENLQSCAPSDVCFLRVGINNAIQNSDVPLPVAVSECDVSAPGAIIGTPGDDMLTGTNGNDVIIGLGGNDVIEGGNGDDCLDGGPGNDNVNGSNGTDLIYGGTGDDELDGGNGPDEIHGNTGDDMIVGGNQDDRLFGEEGADTIEDDNGNDTLDGGEGDDILRGGKNKDSLSGGDGSDNLEGGKGKDNLDGGPGTDTLDGGQGADTCINGETNISC